MDDITRYLIEVGEADMTIQDNTGKTPLDYAGTAAQYYQELKTWYQQHLAKKAPEEKSPASKGSAYSETIPVYLRNGAYYTFVVNETDTYVTNSVVAYQK